MKQTVRLKVNGEDYTVAVEPDKTLLWLLREELDLTGTKEGCGAGECGACTVIFNGKAVNSCLVLAVEADGAEIYTIEGEARDGRLSDLQRAFIEHNALQCGFCTPGMIMAARALLNENPHPTEEEIKEAIEGNLCRCTGYLPIIEAIKDVAAKGAKA
ncbi:(2Fe-2S)-binding protein [Neomoorella thermoacetica]|uniref:Nicotinate dehydrogenase small FeS subunit n=1 Tax=Neomoorella thermoacetica TaxID=1525 RepID=A0A1J5NN21_NEOTH|nr:(2Fe-2S)-binding protein [Moorella thermoacetica]OIQ09104.1 nicotinate dehydrogenase small FeS subunit [Moorella thermoacetica]OIQ54843.1 nicotinate dehydrogenase small FeS subunit [Moorella thermoacetica]